MFNLVVVIAIHIDRIINIDTATMAIHLLSRLQIVFLDKPLGVEIWLCCCGRAVVVYIYP